MARTSRKQKTPAVSASLSETLPVFRTAIYARLSVEDNGRDSDSIESQIAYLEEYIGKDPALRLVSVYADNGYTGTNFMRPEFQKLLDAARRGEVNCVVVKDLSRLGRDYVETGEFIEKVCPFLGLRFIAVNDGYDSEAAAGNAQMAASLSNIINDFYARDISRKVSSALRTKMEKGDYIGSWEKYGYRKDPENRNRLIVNPETAPIVRQIFQWRSEGMSRMGINRKLNEMDIPSPGQYRADHGVVTSNNRKPRRIPWNRHVVTEILQDICYLGHLAQRKNGKSLYAGLPLRRMDERDWIVAYNTHEAIIGQELFNRVQEINRADREITLENRGKYDALPKEKNIYGEKLVCADCGARIRLHRSISRKKDRVYFTFNCPTYGEHGETVCKSRVIRKADLDEAVFRSIRAQMDVYLETAQVIRTLIARKQAKNSGEDGKKRKAELETGLKRLRAALPVLYTDWKDGLLTDEEYLLQRQKHRDEAERLEHTLGELTRDEAGAEEKLLGTKRWTAIAEEYARAEELSEELLDACVERIYLRADGSLDIVFNYAEEFRELHELAERLRKEAA